MKSLCGERAHMLADDRPQTERDKRAIDEVTAAFFTAFTNVAGAAPAIGTLYTLFIPEAVIIKNVGGKREAYDVAGFIEPRRSILTDGSLVDFFEEESSESTLIFGSIAQRFSRYRKFWTQAGRKHSGQGTKSIQFVRTLQGWKIASLIWDDESEVPPF